MTDKSLTIADELRGVWRALGEVPEFHVREPDLDCTRILARRIVREAADHIEAQQAEMERLTAMASRVKAAIEWAEPVSDEMLASARGRFSLRETAARFGVGVGRVRGAWQRAALNEGAGQ